MGRRGDGETGRSTRHISAQRRPPARRMNLFSAIFNEKSLSQTAILCDQRRITYEELRNLTSEMAGVLHQLRVTPGDRVALLLNDSPEFIASFIALCSSGAIAVPINMALRLEEQLKILEDCGARTIVGEAGSCKQILAVAKRLRDLREVVVVRNEDQEWPTGSEPTVHFLGELLCDAVQVSPASFTTLADKQPAFILYTSGSTGEPKGAIHCQADLFVTNEGFCREILALRPGDRLFSSSRLPFAYGLGNSFTFPLLNGCTSVLCREKPTPEVIARVLAEYDPTIFFAVPVVYNLLLERHRQHEPLDCSSLRLCISAGEALPAHLGEEWERTFNLEVLDGIGSTEMLHMWMSNHSGEVRYGSSGKLLKKYKARLVDQEGNTSAPLQEGNLWVMGASTAQGYWNKPEATASTFVDGWVRTGDLYRSDADGYWFHLGRSDDCFKSSGQWVSPVEVEGALLRHEGVSQVAVVADLDDAQLPCASAFVVCKQVESDPTRIEAELRQLTRELLPRFKQPRRYLFVQELPYTATGKVQRFKLREELK